MEHENSITPEDDVTSAATAESHKDESRRRTAALTNTVASDDDDDDDDVNRTCHGLDGPRHERKRIGSQLILIHVISSTENLCGQISKSGAAEKIPVKVRAEFKFTQSLMFVVGCRLNPDISDETLVPT
ncbi:hypothetical protein F2P81_006826 [Scophthalmus maximus]|uniref:Uncharacterized protein n=1 Tax=Scophthalmus maximus TaxID=52904 RepID=A0A6A4T977_SCOMX|nr:hypothetical protein F2P81_006826 [Scophthalmus maximus]